MSTALKISANHFIVLDNVEELFTNNSDGAIHIIIDHNREDILISVKDFGEAEYHRIKREIEEFFSIEL
jgi:hypothetical protein